MYVVNFLKPDGENNEKKLVQCNVTKKNTYPIYLRLLDHSKK